MTSWDGELVASLFVGFAYENHYLRVVVRPHVVNPVHPVVREAEKKAAAAGWAWRRRTVYLAAVDTGWCMDDMLQYDDARRYVEMMQGRVLAAVEGFLVEHNSANGPASTTTRSVSAS